MNYDDKFVLNNNIFSFVIYKSFIKIDNNPSISYKMCSVQQCFLFNLKDLRRIIKLFPSEPNIFLTDNIERLLPELGGIPAEEYWSITLTNIEKKEKIFVSEFDFVYRKFKVKSMSKADENLKFLFLEGK